MRRFLFCLFLIAATTLAATSANAQKKSKSKKLTDKDDEISLKRLFPKESFFGPRARSSEFSQDGRYAAYLYKTFDERRHGNDLWIYDFKTGENTRITNLALMAEFQRNARVVKQDRLSKNKKAKKDKDKDDDKSVEDEQDTDASGDKDNDSKSEKDIDGEEVKKNRRRDRRRKQDCQFGRQERRRRQICAALPRYLWVQVASNR